MVRRVAVRAQDELAGQHQRLLTDHLVADAAARVEEVRDPLLGDELADLGVIPRMFGRRRGHSVVEDDRQPVGTGHAADAQAGEQPGDRRSVVVAQDHIGPRVHDLADLDRGQA